MGQVMSLGSTQFVGWTATEKLKLPRHTAMSTHEIPQTDDTAAEKISQTFGVYPDTITLEGTLLGQTADDDLRSLEAMQDDQRVVPFTIATRVFDVIIASIDPEFVSIGEINFTVTLEPLLERRSSALSPQGPDAATQFNAALQAIIDQQNSIDAAAAELQAQQALTLKVQALQDELDAIVTGHESIGDILTGSIAQQLGFQSTLAGGITAVQNLLNTLRAMPGMSTYVQQFDALNMSMSSAYKTLQTYTGQASNTPTVREANTTVYAIAAKYTGDWTNFRAIMDANGLKDPKIVGVVNLVIPRV